MSETWRHQVRTGEICGLVAALARQAGAGGKLPRVVELCEMLKVSPRTLDKALGELEARDIITRQRGIGIFAGARSRRNIIVLVSFHLLRSAQHSPFWDILLERMESYQSERQENVKLRILTPAEFDEPPADLTQKYQTAGIDGVIGIGLESAITKWLVDSSIPFVAFAGYAPHVVQIDEAETIQMGIKALVNRGCQSLGFAIARGRHLIAQKHDGGIQEKVQIFRMALQEQGLKFHPDLIEDGEKLVQFAGERVQRSAQEQGFDWVKRLHQQSTLPDGLLLLDDLMTVGALTALHSYGVQIGKDVVLASHANQGVPLFLGDTDKVIRMEIAPDEVVRMLFEMMEALLSGDDVEAIRFIRPQLHPPTPI